MSPADQDPVCHRAALALAAQRPGFVWNEVGMDVYFDEYEACERLVSAISN